MKNRIEDLRNHLFATLEALQDDKNPMPLDRAKAISDVSQTIINSAKVEVDFLNAVGGAAASGFFPGDELPGKPPKLKLARN
jgi:hypothetical protein